MSLEGKSHPVEILYLHEPCNNYVLSAVSTVVSIHENEPDGDILVFLTGQEEVDMAVEMLIEATKSFRKKSSRSLQVFPLYSALPTSKQLRVFPKAARGLRKVVVATNICESSVTIDGVAYVVDCCFTKLPAINSDTGVNHLIVSASCRSSATQRAGRAGRTRPGKCYRLLKEESFDSELGDFSIPEVLRVDLAPVLLFLKCLGIDNLLHFEFVTPPTVESFSQALETLFLLGIIDDTGVMQRPFGYQIAALPLDCYLNRMLVLSGTDEYKCSEEALTIAAMLSCRSPWSSTNKRDYLESCKLSLGVTEGDLVTLYNVFQQFFEHHEESGDSGWAGRHMINHNVVNRAKAIRTQLAKAVKQQNIPMSSCGNDSTKLTKLLCATFFINAAQRVGTTYVLCRRPFESPALTIHSSSVLTGIQPPWVVFREAICSGIKTEMIGVTKIDMRWLPQVAPKFYNLNLKK